MWTHIEDFVESVRAITPAGEWESRRLPGSGAGVSPDRMLAGSEGILGVITEAWMRVQPRPTHRRSAGVSFADFATGAECARELSQSGLHPANCRLIDQREAKLTMAGDGSKRCWWWASSRPTTRWTPRWSAALEICREHGGEARERGGGGPDAVSTWRETFLAAPYLRDVFVAMGAISETFETAITWERFAALYERVMAAAEQAMREVGAAAGRGVVSLHARLPRRPRPLLHSARQRAARGGAGAVGGDQARGVGCDHRGRRHDHPSPRGRPRPSPLV